MAELFCSSEFYGKCASWSAPFLFACKNLFFSQRDTLYDCIIMTLCLTKHCKFTADRRQSKMLLTIDECVSKINRNSVFYCHLSPIRRQMAIKNSVSNDISSTFVNSINILDCGLSGLKLDIKLCIYIFKASL